MAGLKQGSSLSGIKKTKNGKKYTLFSTGLIDNDLLDDVTGTVRSTLLLREDEERRKTRLDAQQAQRTLALRQADHNMAEATRLATEPQRQLEFLAAHDRRGKMLRRMIREWKKDQPKSIQYNGKTMWVPGRMVAREIGSKNGKPIFRDQNGQRWYGGFDNKQDAADFTRIVIKQEPNALVQVESVGQAVQNQNDQAAAAAAVQPVKSQQVAKNGKGQVEEASAAMKAGVLSPVRLSVASPSRREGGPMRSRGWLDKAIRQAAFGGSVKRRVK